MEQTTETTQTQNYTVHCAVCGGVMEYLNEYIPANYPDQPYGDYFEVRKCPDCGHEETADEYVNRVFPQEIEIGGMI